MIGGALWAIAAAYLAITAMLFLFQRRLVFASSRQPIGGPADSEVPEMRPLRYPTADGLELTAWYAPSRAGAAQRQLTIVYFHGNAGTLADRAFKARFLLDRGYGMLLTGYRGYGGNPGRPSEAGVYADARAALDYLASLGVPSARTVLYGESLGTGVAVQMALERQAAALVLESPYSSLTDVAAYHYWWTPARWVLRDRFDSLAKIGRVRMPILILHGERDLTIPIRFGRRLFAAAPEPKEFRAFSLGAHEGLFDEGAGEAIDDFLKRLPGGR
jgi:fermentation-respiration switch protein FrsA (DUF1100 family)